MTTVRRVPAFVDRPRERFAEAAAFWTAVTGTRLSPRRGDDGEFTTSLPGSGDAWVKLQAVRDGAALDRRARPGRGTYRLTERDPEAGGLPS